MEETLEALHDLVKAGKVRYIGASSMAAWQFAKYQYLADRHGWTRYVTMQNHYNLIYREEEREMIPLCREEKVGCIPWSSVARGFLAGNRTRAEARTLRAKTDEFGNKMYGSDDDFAVVERNETIARRLGVKPAQLALAWVLANPVVTSAIVGTSKFDAMSLPRFVSQDIPYEETKITLTFKLCWRFNRSALSWGMRVLAARRV